MQSADPSQPIRLTVSTSGAMSRWAGTYELSLDCTVLDLKSRIAECQPAFKPFAMRLSLSGIPLGFESVHQSYREELDCVNLAECGVRDGDELCLGFASHGFVKGFL
eukprot:TRINITY_DN29957_c0_g1_i1.p1 TRINITY_DN29957_c0_g1~~TRINITY_DN29957_c0_g1_i1.p1  ORF type:complete len:107 (+),score=10.18 TRINITY_DN29957_c0_g1_i1:256-576(+)